MEHSAIIVPRRRDQVLVFVIQWIVRNNGNSPTLDEIASGLGISKTRAKQLVEQVVASGDLVRTPGAQRNLRVGNTPEVRALVVHALNQFGAIAALPMGELQQPCPNVQLHRLPEIRHLPEA